MVADGDQPQVRVRINGSKDLVAALPTLVGFKPENSLVALCVDSASKRLTRTLRVDMPETGADAAQVAETVGYHLRSEPSSGVTLVAVTADDDAARHLVGLVAENLGRAQLLRALRVDGDRYWDLEDPASSEGRPVGRSEAADKVAAAEVLRGRAIFGSREQLEATFVPAEPVLRRQAHDAMAAVRDRFVATLRERGERAALDGLSEAAASALEAAVEDPGGFTPRMAGVLVVAASIVPVRDRLLLRVDRVDAHKHVDAWRLTAIHASGKAAAAPYALAAFTSWLSGDGATAQVALQRAYEADPDYSLARVTWTAVATGLSPSVGWQALADDELGR